ILASNHAFVNFFSPMEGKRPKPVAKVALPAVAASGGNVAQVSQPAVSPISNRQRVQSQTVWNSRRPQAGSTAIQQVGKPALRLCQRPPGKAVFRHRKRKNRVFKPGLFHTFYNENE